MSKIRKSSKPKSRIWNNSTIDFINESRSIQGDFIII